MRFCDMVMKGGITSGVIYPLAIVRLSERFRFKNIGGTSAGAIAAAAAALAEVTRETGGFERLQKLPDFLQGTAPEGSGSTLAALFQPQPATGSLFRIGMAGLGGGWGWARMLGWTLVEYATAACLGMLPGSLFLGLALASAEGLLFVACCVVSLLLMVLGVIAAVGYSSIRDLVVELPANGYGLCNGMSAQFADLGETPAGKSAPLTFWLTEYYNSFLGRKANERPATFGDLWGDSPERNVNLEMMTTCLTHGRPYRLPFRDDEDVRENRLFYFRREEFEKLFPTSVVEWMVQNPRPLQDREAAAEKRAALEARGVFPLPAPKDLPVVVAVRMSLSFPILLSAIPLYCVDRKRDPEGESPERCWFTDGGVCSNFPIHFFDAPLPRWPTLSVNLVEKPQGTSAEVLQRPEMPGGNADLIQERWNRFEVREESTGATEFRSFEKSGFAKLTSFVWALISTMQNWTDNTQSRLPGYRDRIAHVGLTPEEGGLNLNMPRERIDALTKRGEAAAEVLIERFGVPSQHPRMHWENHRWLRLRACLASVETLLAGVERGCAGAQAGDHDYESWVRETPPGGGAPSYDWTSVAQQELAARTLSELRVLAANREESGTSLGQRAPRPRAELRPRPQI